MKNTKTGTGKTAAARALHDRGPRRGGPCLVANLAAISPTLIEAARMAVQQGDLPQASQWLTRAAELRAQSADMDGVGLALLASAGVLLRERRPRAARRKLEAARDAVGEHGPLEVRAELWRGFAETDLMVLDAFVYEEDPLCACEDEAGLDLDLTTDGALEE